MHQLLPDRTQTDKGLGHLWADLSGEPLHKARLHCSLPHWPLWWLLVLEVTPFLDTADFLLACSFPGPHTTHTQAALLFPLKIYLKDIESFLPSLGSFPKRSQWPGLSQTKARISIWVSPVGNRGPGTSAAFPRASAWSCMENGAVGTWPSIRISSAGHKGLNPQYYTTISTPLGLFGPVPHQRSSVPHSVPSEHAVCICWATSNYLTKKFCFPEWTLVGF